MPQSPNKATISSLVETLQKKVEPAKLYDALRKMNDDLNKAYDALFFGPLPPVSGENLTDLNALELDGIVPEENLPANLAFQDRENFFDEINFFVAEDREVLKIGFGVVDESEDGTRTVDDINSWFRIGPLDNNEFFLSQNFSWDGSSWTRDDEVLDGFIATIIAGDLQFSKWLPADAFDYPAAYLADTWFFHGKELGIANYAQDDELSFSFLDENDIFFLGESASTFADLWRGHIAIPNKVDTDLPPTGEPICNGIICIDKTAADLVYYTNGLRYRINGTAF